MQGSRTLPWYHAGRTLLSASAVNSYSTVSAVQCGPVRFNLTPCFVNHSVFRRPRILRRARRPTPLKSTTRALAQTVPPISPTGEPAFGGYHGKLYATSPRQQLTAASCAEESKKQNITFEREGSFWRGPAGRYGHVGSFRAHHQRLLEGIVQAH